MSCGGGHLGFPIGIKNKNFVEDFIFDIHRFTFEWKVAFY
jgi:hypothetical protein